MCTKPRIIVPGVYYHVTSRGVFGEKILQDPELKKFLLRELKITLDKFSFTCVSWSIMDDHYHLIVKSSQVTISRFMQRLNSVYAKKFNREKNREGVVFFRRYASVISEETELKKLIRYVHMNPVRCGACTLEELDRYEWCGHSSVVNADDAVLDNKSLLDQFNASDPVGDYCRYLNSAETDCEKEIIRIVRNANRGKMNFSKPELWVIGSYEFVQAVLREDRCRKTRIARHSILDISLKELHETLRNNIYSEEEELFFQGRINQKSTARELFAYAGACSYDFRNTEIAEYLKVDPSAVSRMISRYNRITQKDYLIDAVCSCLEQSEKNC
ncbi:MAG: transposase [Chitinispirillaceae bacterium]